MDWVPQPDDLVVSQVNYLSIKRDHVYLIDGVFNKVWFTHDKRAAVRSGLYVTLIDPWLLDAVTYLYSNGVEAAVELPYQNFKLVEDHGTRLDP